MCGWLLGCFDMTPEDTGKKQAATLFEPGQSGNPAGRPKGARNKLGEAFIQALQEDFEAHGVAAVQAVRTDKPDQYLKVIASLMPKEHRLSVSDQFTDMTDDELTGRIRQLAATIAPFLDGGVAGADEAVGGAESPKLDSRVH